MVLEADSEDHSIFITPQPSQRRVTNAHNVAMDEFDLENLMNSSTDNVVGSVESLCPLDVEGRKSVLDVSM